MISSGNWSKRVRITKNNAKVAQRTITQEQKTHILALAEDFPRLWKDPLTSDRDRKRMARLILEDVTLKRDHSLITVQVRFKGGATKVLACRCRPPHGNCARPKRRSSPKSIVCWSNAPTPRWPPNSTKRVGVLRKINPSVQDHYQLDAPITNW